MNRKEFIVSGAAFAALEGCLSASTRRECDYDAFQREIEGVTPADYAAYNRAFSPDMTERFPALGRLEEAFKRVMREIGETKVTDRPAVWLVYNMGLVVKTPGACFAVDLRHRQGHLMAPLLDFALITHNHGDHFTERFYAAMDGAGKTVISNFKDNYGAADWTKWGEDWAKNGGYTRAAKTFRIKDVEIRTGLTDHNGYLVDFTSTFEIKSHGFTIYHTGDCSNIAKLNPTVTPDLWVVHPLCGLAVADGVRKFHPKMTAIAHLNELGHSTGQARWSWSVGFREKAAAETAGGAACVPVWGERIV